jgi:ubiquitin carboxyl-terminal hydrolase L3
MARLLKDGIPCKPYERTLVLENSNELETAYASVAKKGDTEAPPAEDEVDFHYICYVKSDKDNHLYSMDGDRERPIDLGELGADDDVLSDMCLDVIRDLIKSAQSVNFNLMALAPALD